MRLYFLIFLLLYTTAVHSDIVKPALVEINVFSDNTIEVEIRASIEAILTGINSQYKNTQDAPQAQSYDILREKPAFELQTQFKTFSSQFINHIWLQADQSKVDLKLLSVEVPEPGYTKVPRISTIKLSSVLPQSTHYLRWYYPAKFSDNAIRVRQINEAAQQWHWGQWQWIRDNQPSKNIELKQTESKTSKLSILGEYITIGFRHIIPKGRDHLLFILGLFLTARQWRPLLLQVTAFTAAHTLTLGLASLEYINISPTIVEPMIALSIFFMGLECLLARPVGKIRLITIFTFGLLHGLGFANAIAEFNLSSELFLTALIGFNVGVELAQILVLLLAWVAIGWWIPKDHYKNYCVIPLSTLICLTGLVWFFNRIS